MGHDPLCPILVTIANECECELLTKARMDERQQMADNLWTHIQPIVDWIAGVNTTKEVS